MILAPQGMPPLPRPLCDDPVLAADVRPLEEAAQHLLLVRRCHRPASLGAITVATTGTTIYRRIARHEVEGPLYVWLRCIGDTTSPSSAFEMSLSCLGATVQWTQGYEVATVDLVVPATASGGVEDITLVVNTDAEGPEILAWGVLSLPYLPPYAEGYTP